MNSRSLMLLAFLAVVILVCAIVRFQSPAPAPPRPKVVSVKKPAIVVPEKKGEPFQIPENFDWSQMTKEDIGDLTVHFDCGRGKSSEWEGHVKLGQTFVTNIYEGAKPGQYIVSRIKPELNKSGDKKKPYKLKVSMESFDLGGRSAKLSQYDMQMHYAKPGQLAGTMVLLAEKGAHMLTVTAKPEANGSSLSIRGKGGYFGDSETKSSE